MMHEWVSYSDRKGVALLGIQGILTGLVLSFLRGLGTSFDLTLMSKVFLFASIAAIALSMFFTLLCLTPRLKRSGRIKVSPLYFGSIASHFKDSDAYMDFLKENFSTEDKVNEALAAQIHANAGIARAKFKWVSWATRLLILGLLFLAVSLVFML